MTINTTTTRVSYTGNGVTTAFSVPFVFFGASELEVIRRVIATGAETVLALTTNYTVSGGNGTTGTVTAIVAPTAAVQWTIRRNTARTQLVDYAPNDPFPADTHERALDRLTAIAQETAEGNDRAVKFPKTDAPTISTELPSSAIRANKVIGCDATGALTVYDPAALAATGAIYADYLRSQFSGNGSTTVFTLPADPVTRDNVNIYISGVYQQKDRYTVAGAALTFVTAPPVGTNNIEVIQGQGVLVGAVTPPDSSVTTQKIADGAVTARKESDDPWFSVASAATVDLGVINSRNAIITGTTGITSFGNTGGEGRTMRVRFAASLTMTNSASLILPGAANITTASGDTGELVKEAGTAIWRMTDFQRASGQPLVGSASGLVLLSSQSASGSASLDFTSLIDSTYDEYVVSFDKLIPATNDVDLYLRVSTNNGSSYLATSYSGVTISDTAAGRNTQAMDTTAVNFTRAAVGNNVSNSSSQSGASGEFRIYPNGTATPKPIRGLGLYYGVNGAYWNMAVAGAYTGATSAVNAVRLLFSSGNIASGTARLYGVRRIV
jgi:hypothetical protein